MATPQADEQSQSSRDGGDRTGNMANLETLSRDVRQVADRLGMEPREVMNLLGAKLDILDPAVGIGRRSEEDLVRAVRAASRIQWPLTSSDYNALVQSGEITGPSSGYLNQRFGAWSDVLARAGVELGPLQSQTASKYSQSELVETMREFFDRFGRNASARQYVEWRASERPGLPSRALIEGRLGGWTGARRAVFGAD